MRLQQWYHSIVDVALYRIKGHLCRSNIYIKRYGTSKFIKLTSRKGNPNGPQQGDGRNCRVTDREPSFRARSIDQKDGTHHEEQLSSNSPSVIRPSSATTGTHAGTPPLPTKKSGTGVGRILSKIRETSTKGVDVVWKIRSNRRPVLGRSMDDVSISRRNLVEGATYEPLNLLREALKSASPSCSR